MAVETVEQHALAPVSPRIVALERAEALDAVGVSQSALVQTHLRPFLNEIEQDLTALRREIDAALGDGKGTITSGSPQHGGYPIGYCKPIRDLGLHRLLNPRADDIKRPAVAALASFRAAGGVVKGIWGVQKGAYFQNAIQAGDLWLDLANDTVDPSRRSVEILPLGQAEFEDITSFGHYARVAESYWGYRAFPNLYFPHLAAFFPVLLLTPQNYIRVPAPATLCPRNIRLNFGPARDFFKHGAFVDRRLPEACLDRMDRAARNKVGFFGPESGRTVDYLREGTPDLALGWIEKERRQLLSTAPHDYFERFAEFLNGRRASLDLN